MRTRFLALGTVAAALLVGAATMQAGLAQDKAALVTERQDTMKLQGKLLGTAAGFAQGKSDQAQAEAAVNQLIATTTNLLDKFPPGTSAADFPGKSGAKPEFWTEMDKVKGIVPGVIQQEQKLLAAIKSGDKEAVGKQANATWNDGCQTCHNPYRLKL
jgi:cytochrome c556